MQSTRRRTVAAALALATALGLATAGTALAAPKKPAPAPPAVVKVLPQVQLRVNPVAKTPQPGDFTAVVTVKAPAGAPVTGTFQLVEGAAVLGSGSLAAGTGTVAVDLAPGTHRLTAVYGGSAKVSGAATKVVEVVVPVS